MVATQVRTVDEVQCKSESPQPDGDIKRFQRAEQLMCYDCGNNIISRRKSFHRRNNRRYEGDKDHRTTRSSRWKTSFNEKPGDLEQLLEQPILSAK